MYNDWINGIINSEYLPEYEMFRIQDDVRSEPTHTESSLLTTIAIVVPTCAVVVLIASTVLYRRYRNTKEMQLP